MNRRDEAFALFKAPHIAEAIARNAPWMKAADNAVLLEMPREVVVIGAGWTLPDYLSKSDRQCTIAVNSALLPLAHRGFVPDFILCRESIDMSEHIKRAAALTWSQEDRERWPIAILDIGTNHQTWQTCRQHCAEVLWFVPASTQTFGLAALYGQEPLYGGTSNVTAAVALAQRWGAERIELLGCSRAFAPDGRAYASGSDWETVRIRGVEARTLPDGTVDHYLGHMSGLESKERLHAASGQRPPLRVERVVPVEAVDGSRRWSLETLEGDREWLQNFATRYPELVLWQHDPDVAIAGWDLRKPAQRVEMVEVDIVAELRAQVQRSRAVASALFNDTPAVDAPGLLDGTPLVDYHAVGETMAVMRALRGKGAQVTVPAVMRAWQEGADRVERWIAGERTP